MEDARAAKGHKISEKWIQVRLRSGSKDRDGTRLKHVSFQTKAEARTLVSGE